MSKCINQSFQDWEAIQHSVGCIRPHRAGVELSRRDRITYFDVLKFNALLLNDVAPPSERRKFSNLVRWVKHHYNNDVLRFSKNVKRVLNHLFQWTESTTLKAFKQSLEMDAQEFGDLLSPVLDILREFLDVGTSSSLRILNQFLSFSGRMSLVDLDIIDEMISEYKAQELRLSRLHLPVDIIQELNSIVREWFSSYQTDLTNVRHGPGSSATFGRIGKYYKNCNTYVDDRLLYLIHGESYDLPQFIRYRPFPRVAEVTFVPKSSTTLRTICMEPVSLMYFQQACWRTQEKFISCHPYLGSRIRLSNQDYNKSLARVGSRTGYFATIDLSAASDSVSWSLIKQMFKGTPLLREYWCTRSDYSRLPDGSLIANQKFAPMGSSECFPTECIVFAAICEYVVRKNPKLSRTRENFSVYGDDIAIQHDLADDVISVLGSLGFRVNTEKSFTRGFFRESCGGEYWKGDDVTPLRIPRNFSSNPLHVKNPGLYACCIELCNNAYFHPTPLLSLRRHLLRRFDVLPRNLRPLFDKDGTTGIATQYPTNYDKVIYHDFGLQTAGWKHGDVKDAPCCTVPLDEFAIFEWQREAGRRDVSRYQYWDPDNKISLSLAESRVSLGVGRSTCPNLSDDFSYHFVGLLYKSEEA